MGVDGGLGADLRALTASTGSARALAVPLLRRLEEAEATGLALHGA